MVDFQSFQAADAETSHVHVTPFMGVLRVELAPFDVRFERPSRCNRVVCDRHSVKLVYDDVQAMASQSPPKIGSVGTKTVLQFYDRYNAGDIDGGASPQILAPFSVAVGGV